jgi:hypothetical protein
MSSNEPIAKWINASNKHTNSSDFGKRQVRCDKPLREADEKIRQARAAAAAHPDTAEIDPRQIGTKLRDVFRLSDSHMVEPTQPSSGTKHSAQLFHSSPYCQSRL